MLKLLITILRASVSLELKNRTLLSYSKYSKYPLPAFKHSFSLVQNHQSLR